MNRERRAEIRWAAKSSAAGILEEALGSMDPRYDDEDEQRLFEEEIGKIAHRIVTGR